MLQEIKDEVLAGEPLYVIEGSDGTVLQDNVKITRKTPVVEEATELNRATFANLQGDLYTQDRYNVPVVTSENGNFINNLSLPLTSYEVGKIIRMKAQKFEGNVQSNAFAKNWIKESTSKYIAGDGSTITGNVMQEDGRNLSQLFNLQSGEANMCLFKNFTSLKLELNLAKVIKIKKMAIYAFGSAGSMTIKAYTNDSWKTLLTVDGSSLPIAINPEDVIQIESPEYSSRYLIEVTGTRSSTSIYISHWQTIEYETKETSFSNPYININNLGTKLINGTIEEGERYSLVYNGKSFDISKDYVVGTYTGNGNASQFIDLGFTPSAVFVTDVKGATYNPGSSSYSYYFGGLAIKDYPTIGSTTNIVEIVENGFNVYYTDSNAYRALANGSLDSYNPYRYIAFK